MSFYGILRSADLQLIWSQNVLMIKEKNLLIWKIFFCYYFRHSFKFKNNYSFLLHTINTCFLHHFYFFLVRIIKYEFGSGLQDF